jgi:hypothetical protein
MTDIELAKQLFSSQSSETSKANASILTGTALSNSADGKVLVLVNGAQGNQINRGVTLPCTFSVSAGETVIITLYGQDGKGKKGFVSGRIGESGGGGDISQLEQRVTTLEGEVVELDGDLTTLTGDVSTLSGTVSTLSGTVSTINSRWGFWDVGTLKAGSQLTGRGIWKFMNIGGTVLSHWPSGKNVGDYTGICFDYNPLGYATMIATSPRTNTIFLLKKWAGEFDYVRAV